MLWVYQPDEIDKVVIQLARIAYVAMRLVRAMPAKVRHVAADSRRGECFCQHVHTRAAIGSAVNQHRYPLPSNIGGRCGITAKGQRNSVAGAVVFKRRQIAVVDAAELVAKAWRHRWSAGCSKQQHSTKGSDYKGEAYYDHHSADTKPSHKIRLPAGCA